MTEDQESVEPEMNHSAGEKFPCEECGANLTWDPDADALSCEFCGSTQAVPRVEGEIIERGLEEVGEAARGFGIELRVMGCKNCGARVTLDAHTTSELCVYCGSANVLAQEANRNALRPESLVPLDVGRKSVEAQFKRWLGRLWFRPNELKRTKKFNAVGVYVPFWVFDAEVDSTWSADAGHYYYVTQTYTTMVNGKPQVRTRQVRKVRWVPAWGERSDTYDDFLVHASIGQPLKLIEKLGQFDTSDLVAYQPEYLAGWRAEEYQIDLEDGWSTGRNKVVDWQHKRCAGDIPGDTHRNLNVRNQIYDVRWKHVLLPIWSLQYAFRGETYTVLVHGQNGHVVGHAPYSWVKIGLAIVALIAVVLLATLLLSI